MFDRLVYCSTCFIVAEKINQANLIPKFLGNPQQSVTSLKSGAKNIICTGPVKQKLLNMSRVGIKILESAL